MIDFRLVHHAANATMSASNAEVRDGRAYNAIQILSPGKYRTTERAK